MAYYEGLSRHLTGGNEKDHEEPPPGTYDVSLSKDSVVEGRHKLAASGHTRRTDIFTVSGKWISGSLFPLQRLTSKT